MKKILSIILAMFVCIASYASTEYPDFKPGSKSDEVKSHIQTRDRYVSLYKNGGGQDYICLAVFQQEIINGIIDKVNNKLSYHVNSIPVVENEISRIEKLNGNHKTELENLNRVMIYHKKQIEICKNEIASIKKLNINFKF